MLASCLVLAILEMLGIQDGQKTGYQGKDSSHNRDGLTEPLTCSSALVLLALCHGPNVMPGSHGSGWGRDVVWVLEITASPALRRDSLVEV